MSTNRPTANQISVGSVNLDRVVTPDGGLAVGANATFTSNIFDTPIINVTGSATFADNAAGKILMANSTAAITLTFAAAASANGFCITIVRANTGNVIIANTTAVTKRNTAVYTTANISSQWDSATIIYKATNEIVVIGNIT